MMRNNKKYNKIHNIYDYSEHQSWVYEEEKL